jgi:uncharacterized protein YfaS (alpha-2-macroglobulin family)
VLNDTGTRGFTGAGARLVTIANAVLFVVLVTLIGWAAPDALERRAVSRGPSKLDASAISYSVARVGPAVRVRFSDDVVPGEQVGEEAPAGLITLEPDLPGAAIWQTRRELRLAPAWGLPRARRIHVHLDGSRLDIGGRDLVAAEGVLGWVETPRSRVRGVSATDHGPDGRARSVVVVLDADHLLEDVARHVHVHRIDEVGDAGADLSSEPEALDGEHAWRLRLTDDAVPDHVIVRVDGALTPAGADVPLGEDFERALELRPELHVAGIEPHSDGVSIELDHEVPLPAEGTITFEPPVAFQVHRRWGELRLYGEFRAGSTYRVTLHEGFPGSGPARLHDAVTRSVRLPDHEPKLSFPDRGTVLSSRARREIAVDCMNVARIEVAARTVYANNVVRFAQRGASDHVFGPWTKREIAVAGPRNETSAVRIPLDELLASEDGGTAHGLHEVRVRDLDREARRIRRIVQVTDLGVTVRATPDALALRVTSLAHARPVPGASVIVRTPTNQVLGEGVTADDGTLIVRYAASGEDRVPYLVDVRADTDRTIVDLDGFAVSLAEEQQSGRRYLRGGFECHVHADRGAVRPGETARVTIVGRSARGVSPVGAEVEARWYAPDDGLRRAERLRFEDAGLLAATHTTSPADPTGTWRVDVVDVKTDRLVGSTPFLVEAFVPDRLEAAVELLEQPTLGGKVRLRVRGSWLEGAPAADVPFRAYVRLDHVDWRPDGIDKSMSFRVVDEAAAGAPPGAREPVKGVLGADGSADVVVPLPTVDAKTQALRATVRVEVMDPSGRPVRAGLWTDVLRPGALLGARASDTHVEVVLVNVDGTPYAGAATAHVTLERRRWEWRVRSSRRRGGRRHSRWVPFVVAEPAGRLTAAVQDGQATVELPELRTNGDWIVAVARAEIDGGRLRADATVGGVAPRPDRLRVEGPQRPVVPGEEIDLVVASPTAGTAFVTFESTTVHATATGRVDRGRDTLRVRVPEDVDGPNVHAVVTVVAPQARADATPPYWIAGGTSLALADDARRTDVTISIPEVVLPRSDVSVDVHAPGATHATIALVDEGILRVTGHPDPDPREFFNARRRLETQGADTGTRLMERPGFDPDVLDGGDQDARPAMVARLDAATTAVVETVALFRGPLALDAEGRARVTFSLPEYEGRLRALVIAAGPSRIGAAASSVVVKAPIGLRLAAPRRLAPGDVSTAALTVRNGTGAEARVGVRIAADAGLELRGESDRELVLPAETTTSFDVEIVGTEAATGATISATASAGGERRTVHAVVPVQPIGFHTETRLGVHAAADEQLRIPGSWAPGSRRARVVVAPGVGAELLPSLEALLQYPHGCVEQTSSRAQAVLACHPLLDELSPRAAARAGDHVRQGIARLWSMQTPRGGMAFWPGGDSEVDLGGLVAADFLLDARDQGFPVDSGRLARLVRRVSHRMTARTEPPFRAMAVEILSRSDAAVGPWLPDLAAAVTRPEDRARVALALARTGDGAAARALLDGVEGGGGGDGAAQDGGLLFSPTRERALLLRALLEAAPADARIDVLADALRRDAAVPDTLTTQSQSHAVRALAALHLRNMAQARTARGTVRIDGVVHTVDGRTEIVVPTDAAGEIQLDLDHGAFVLVEAAGIRIDDAPAPADGAFRVSRTIVDVETGREVDVLRRGGLYEVVLDVRVARECGNLLVTDPLPAGLEAESPRHGAHEMASRNDRRPDHVNVRDDRVLLHVDGPLENDFRMRYRAHAVFPGRYAAAPPVIEALYVPGSAVQGTGTDGVEVTR